MRRKRPAARMDDLGAVDRAASERAPVARERTGGMRVFATVLTIAVVASAWLAIGLHRNSTLLAEPDTGPADRAVLFVVDGASPSDFSLVPMPHLQGLIKRGTTYNNAWLGQLEPNPAASGASIGTGSLPRSHGIIGASWTDPQTGTATHILDPSQVQLGSIDQVMESHGASTLAARIKSLSSGDKVLAVGGVGCQGPAAAGSWLADYILCATKDGSRWAPASVAGHRPPAGPLNSIGWSVPVLRGPLPGPTLEGWKLGQQDDWVSRYAATALRVTGPRLTVIDFPEVALIGPYVTPDHRRQIVGTLMAGIDRGIGRIETELRRERRLKHALFVVTSSEAVTPFTDTLSKKSIQNAVQAAGAQTIYLDTDGMAWVGLNDPSQALPVAQAIDAQHILNVDAIFYKSERGQTWSYQPEFLNPQLPARYGDAAGYLLNTIASNASPDVVVAYAPHIGTEGQAGRYLRAGYLQSLQWQSQHIPLILSGQGVFPNARSAYPARLVDIAPTVEALLGLDPTIGDGVVLADSMFNPTGNSIDRQKEVAPQLQSIIGPLKDRLSQAGG